MDYRTEKDTMGEIKVPADKYWGAQTQRCKENFKIGTEKMPLESIYALTVLKKAAAKANCTLGTLSKEKAELIMKVCDEILEGKLDEHFPLAVWQTGSATQSNMNVNEVIANRGNDICGEKMLHPNDDVNKSQSSNDTFPTALHITAIIAVKNMLLPAADKLASTFEALAEKYKDILKVGRTHLQDATPLSLGQEIGAWADMIRTDTENIIAALDFIRPIAIGATAVGTGLNAPKGFDEKAAEYISEYTGEKFIPARNKFQALTSKAPITFVHAGLKALACDLLKIANDVRFLACGPRSGIGEIKIPENEPGSSIMPGKVNPTQCEALSMLSVQVMANDTAISFGASQGNFQLNVYMPLIIHNFMQSVRLLSDGMISFNDNCAVGIEPDLEVINRNLENSLMLVTALNPVIGYENSAKIAKTAHADGTTLKEAAVKLGILTEEQFDKNMDIQKMVYPHEER
ncbi:MAG: class II fumarate hydratase [Anaerofustis stercorihominis]|nr:class II fumarate hydratase [Anaerofustis stercorihominis]